MKPGSKMASAPRKLHFLQGSETPRVGLHQTPFDSGRQQNDHGDRLFKSELSNSLLNEFY
jgi:hypothetical protein